MKILLIDNIFILSDNHICCPLYYFCVALLASSHSLGLRNTSINLCSSLFSVGTFMYSHFYEKKEEIPVILYKN